MARTAKMNMIMHGDGHGGVHHHDGLLNVNGIFENRFDVILTNPPFGARVEKSLVITEADKFTDVEMIKFYKAKYGEEAYTNALAQINDHVGEPVLNLFDSGKLSALTEVLFIERCIRLLKPGGRLGIVLPEGVLNNQNLQMVRELFEGRAKIILITSIPQDVFMASGAMIKPSIMFFKKFTNEEGEQYKEIVKTVKREITSKYSDTIAELNAIIENKEYTRSERASKRRELRSLEIKIEEEAKPLIKERFDYLIPIAQIDKAGITTTGSECENELTDLVREFVPYREKNILWKVTSPKYQYKVKDEKLLRLSANENWIELC